MTQLSVVVSTKDRPEMLKRCLQALAVQSQPAADFEVVLVDDGSAPPLEKYVVQDEFPYRINILRQESQGQAAALNRGAEAARSRFCLFLDDDVQPDPLLVAEHLGLQRRTGGVIAVGHLAYEASSEADKFASAVAQWMRQHYARLDQRRTPIEFTDCYSGNLSVPRATFIAAGGFSTLLKRGFDEELAYRLEQHGLKVRYLPRASAIHVLYKRAATLLRDSEEAGAAYAQMCEWHPQMLDKLPLSRFNEARSSEVYIRRLLLLVAVPPPVLAFVGELFPMGRAKIRLYSLIHRYAFWRGARKAMRRPRWEQLTSRPTFGCPERRDQ